MGELKIKLTDETEAVFRKSAMEAFGYSKGSLSSAAEQAFMNWAAAQPKSTERTESLGKLMGVLKHVKKSSVELQHEIGAIREAHARRR